MSYSARKSSQMGWNQNTLSWQCNGNGCIFMQTNNTKNKKLFHPSTLSLTIQRKSHQLPFKLRKKKSNKKGKQERERGCAWNARIKGKGDGVEQPSPLVFCNPRRKPRAEPNEIGAGITQLAPFFMGEGLVFVFRNMGRSRGEVGGVLESERDPCEQKEDGEQKREGMRLLQKVDKWWGELDALAVEWVLWALAVPSRVCHHILSPVSSHFTWHCVGIFGICISDQKKYLEIVFLLISILLLILYFCLLFKF